MDADARLFAAACGKNDLATIDKLLAKHGGNSVLLEVRYRCWGGLDACAIGSLGERLCSCAPSHAHSSQHNRSPLSLRCTWRRLLSLNPLLARLFE